MPQGQIGTNQPANQNARNNPGGFKPGQDPRRGPGRGPRPNHLTRDIKRGIVDAAIKHGSNGKGKDGLTGYMFHLASKHPKAFAGLLAKTLPLQVSGSVANFIGTVNLVSVPADRYLSADDIARLTPPLEGIASHTPESPDPDWNEQTTKENIVSFRPSDSSD